jgi:hypothetical protein
MLTPPVQNYEYGFTLSFSALIFLQRLSLTLSPIYLSPSLYLYICLLSSPSLTLYIFSGSQWQFFTWLPAPVSGIISHWEKNRNYPHHSINSEGTHSATASIQMPYITTASIQRAHTAPQHLYREHTQCHSIYTEGLHHHSINSESSHKTTASIQGG